MKKLYSKWSGEEYKVTELTYKVHFKRTKTVEAKIRRYEKNNTAYFLTLYIIVLSYFTFKANNSPSFKLFGFFGTNL